MAIEKSQLVHYVYSLRTAAVKLEYLMATQNYPLGARGRVALFLIVAGALLMSTLDQTIVATALDAIRGDLGQSVALVGWTITAYSLGLLIMLPAVGRASEIFGRRRTFVSCVAIFGVGSILCSVAANMTWLKAARLVQAIGGSGFTPTGTGLVVEHFGRSRDKAVGFFGSIFPVGATIGPLVGGMLVHYLNWRWIFIVNVPLCIVLVPLALMLIPRDSRVRRTSIKDVDVIGIVWLGLSATSFMAGCTVLGTSHSKSGVATACLSIALSIGLLSMFIRHLRVVESPLLAARFVVGRGFLAINGFNVLYGGGVAGLVALIPLYAIQKYHVDVMRAALILLPEGVTVFVTSTVAALVLRVTGYRKPLWVGGLVIALSFIALGAMSTDNASYAQLIVYAIGLGFGIGISNPASRNAGLQLAPASAPSLAALRSMGRQLGSLSFVSVATAGIAFSAGAGSAQAIVYVAAGALLLVSLPIAGRVIESRGAW